VFSSERPRRDLAPRTPRAAAVSPALEALEGRRLLSYSPIGSLPDLRVTPQAGAIATYGGPITVTIDVQNLGASSTVEPLSLEPGAPSTADAPPSNVGVYMLRTPHTRIGGAGSIRLGEVPVPTVPQNSVVTVSQTLVLPARPRRFPGSGGTVFLAFRADDLRETQDIDRTNNTAPLVRVGIEAALPDLAAIAIDVPPVMQPGDVIAPTFKIANYGTVNTFPQGPVTVLLVASTDLNFGPTDAILGRYQITNLPGLSEAPQLRTVLGDVTLDDQPNVVTLDTTTAGSELAALPAVSGGYNIGIIIDPLNEIRELHEVGRGPSSALRLVRRVADVPGLPPAGILSAPSPVTNLFPIPAFAPLGNINDFLTNPAEAAQAINAPGSGSPILAALRANRFRPRKATGNSANQ